MDTDSIVLGAMQPGDRGRIAAVGGEDAVSVRMLEMGLLPGEEVEVLGVAPFGDPISLRVRGARLAIRRRDAARITLNVPGTAAEPTAVLAPVAATT